MTLEKKIIGWEIFMSVLFCTMICSALIMYIDVFYDFLSSDYVITFFIIPFVLFFLIYFIMPQPFRDLLLKAKNILSKKDFIYFSNDLSKTKISTDLLQISSKGAKEIQEHSKESILELNPEELEALKSKSRKKTKYAKLVIFLNVGVLSVYLIGFISVRFKIPFLDSFLSLFSSLLLIFLFLRYTYNTFILLQFNKKLNQIDEAPDIKYLDIRDIYEE